MTRIPSLALAALCLTAAALPCAAQTIRLTPHVREVITRDPANVVRSTAVEYSDLDLSSTEGMQTLVWRIEDAARAVCGPAPQPPITYESERRDYETCRRGSVARSVKQLRLPRVQALAVAQAASASAVD